VLCSQTAASVRAHGGRISKLVTRSGRAFAADNFVFATGLLEHIYLATHAWGSIAGASSTQLLQLAGVKHVPVYPIKGYVVEVPYRPGGMRTASATFRASK
jgi:glycine/D-amino acid oxidase-like deaminating enzyme